MFRSWRSRAALFAVAATMTAPVLGPATPAGASARSKLNGAVSGEAPFAIGEGCSFVHQRFLTTLDAKHEVETKLSVDTCVDFPSDGVAFPASGTFLLTARNGTLSGTTLGTVEATLTPAPVDLTLTVTSGTGKFERSSGTLHLLLNWTSNQVDGGPVTGTLTASLSKHGDKHHGDKHHGDKHHGDRSDQ